LSDIPSPAAARGTALHLQIEQYLKGLEPLPEDLKDWEEPLQTLKNENPFVEAEWGYSKNWLPRKWTAKTSWVRVKPDAVSFTGVAARVVDFKTGKQYPDHSTQTKLYVTAVFSKFPEVQEVRAELWYLDQNKIVAENFRREELSELKTLWKEKTKDMLSDTVYTPNPGFYCKWCPFRIELGGPCQM